MFYTSSSSFDFLSIFLPNASSYFLSNFWMSSFASLTASSEMASFLSLPAASMCLFASRRAFLSAIFACSPICLTDATSCFLRSPDSGGTATRIALPSPCGFSPRPADCMPLMIVCTCDGSNGLIRIWVGSGIEIDASDRRSDIEPYESIFINSTRAVEARPERKPLSSFVR